MFTVFTSAYNRGHTIHRVYESLCAQTCRDFEWLVVDDGSTDDVADLVLAWQREADFPVIFHRQANGGQHMANNRALLLARGEFFTMVDSDDGCVPQALDRMAELWASIPVEERHRFMGVGGLCSDEHGKRVGDPFPGSPYDATVLEMHFRDHVRGQKWWCVRTDVLRRYSWEMSRARPSNPWFAMGRKYRLRLVNEVLKVYYQDAPEESLARMCRVVRPWLNVQSNLDTLAAYSDLLTQDPVELLRVAFHYVRFSMHVGRGLARQLEPLWSWRSKLLWAAVLPAATLWYLRDRCTKEVRL